MWRDDRVLGYRLRYRRDELSSRAIRHTTTQKLRSQICPERDTFERFPILDFAAPRFSTVCSFRDSIQTAEIVGFLPEANYMLSCSSCGAKVGLRSALLNQDLAAKTVGFCSSACQESWYEAMLSADAPSRKSSLSRAASANCHRASGLQNLI